MASKTKLGRLRDPDQFSRDLAERSTNFTAKLRARRKNCGRVGALNCDAFDKLLRTKALNLHSSKHISETDHSYQKFRALSRGVVIFFLSPFV